MYRSGKKTVDKLTYFSTYNHLVIVLPKMKKKFEILGELSVQAQSQQVIWRIMLKGFLKLFSAIAEHVFSIL